MTVVAAFVIDTHPVVFGDLLISGVETLGLSLPIVGPVAGLPSNDEGLYGLRQKIAIISDTCVVAFAGDVFRAQLAIKYLRKRAAEGPITREVVDHFFMHRAPMLTTVALVGFLTGKNENGQWFIPFSHNAETFDGGELGHVEAAGRGVKDIRNWAALGTLSQLDGSIPSSRDRVTAKILMLAGLQLRAEHANGSPIVESLCGGGYEIAFMEDGRFQKVDDVSYVIWDAEVVGGDVAIKHPFAIVRQTYVDDVALIRSIRFDGRPDNGEVEVTHRDWKVVLPAYKDVPGVPIPTPEEVSLNARITCHVFLVTCGDDTGVMSHVEVRLPGAPASITCSDRDGTVRTETSREFMKFVSKIILGGVGLAT